YTVTEGTQDFKVNFTASATPAADFDIDATVPADEQSLVSVDTSARTFAANSSTGAITFDIGNVTGDRTVKIALAENRNFPDGWRLVPDSVTLTIEDDPTSGAASTIGFASTTAIELTEDGSPDTSAMLQLSQPDGMPFTAATPVLPLAVSFGGDFDANNPDFTIGFNTAAHGSFSSSPDLLSVAAEQTHSGGQITLSVAPQGDNIPELREEYTVTISQGENFPAGWAVDSGANKLTVRITANDNTVAFASRGSSAVENGANASVAISINRPFPSGATPSVRIDITNNGGATAADYEITGTNYSNGVWTLPVSPTDTATLTVRAVLDGPDAGESVTLALSQNPGSFPEGWDIGAVREHVVTLSDDPLSTVGFTSRTAIELTEDGGAGNAVLQLSQPGGAAFTGSTPEIPLAVAFSSNNENDFTVNFATGAHGSFTSSSNLLSIASGQNHSNGQIALSITPREDEFPESMEEYTVTVSQGENFPDGWSIDSDANKLTVLIFANDNTFTFSDPAPDEINEGSTADLELNFDNTFTDATATLRIDVTGSGIDADDFTISSADSGVSFSAATGGGTLTIPSGATSPVTLSVTARDDGDPEVDEVATFTLNGTHAVTSLPLGWEVDTENISEEITILANQNTVTFGDPSPARIAENGGSATIALNITQPIPAGTAAEDRTITIGQTNADLAIGTDYNLSVAGGTLSGSTWTLPTGAGSATLTVTASSDIANDEALAFSFAAALPDGWSLAGNTTTGITIANENALAARTIMFTDPSSELSEVVGTIDVGITLSEAPSGVLDVTARITDGDQYIELADSTIRIATGTTGNFTLNIPFSVANIPSGTTPTAELALAAPVGWSLGAQGTHTVTITAATARVTFEDGISFVGGTAKYPVREGENVEVKFTASAAHTTAFDIDASIPPADQGYVSVASTPASTFAANQRDGAITFTAIDNPDDEGDRTVVIPLARNANFPPGWRLVPDSVTLNIEEDDDDLTIGFAKAESTVNEGETAVLDLEFKNYTIPSDGVQLKFDASDSTATLSGIDEDARYNRDSITGQLAVNLGQSDTSFDIDILSNGVIGGEEDETVVLTLLGGNDLPDGVTLGTKPTHMITIPANGNTAFFDSSSGQHEATVDEDAAAGEATLMVSLSLAGAPSAPTNGLPLKLDIASGNDNGRGGKLVTFDRDGSEKDMLAFSVTAGQNSYPVTVYILDNSVDVDNDNQEVVFTLSADNSNNDFPTGWGSVPGSTATFTLTVVDDDTAATIGFAEARSNTQEPVDGRDMDDDPYVQQHAVALDLGGSAVPSNFALNIGVSTASTAGAAEYTVPSTVELTTASSGMVTFDVQIHPDIIADDGETLILTIPEEQPNLPDGVNLVTSKLTHTITITDTPPPTVGWERTNITYTPDSQGRGTFQARVVATPMVYFPNRYQFNVRPEASTGTIAGKNQFDIGRFSSASEPITYTVTGSATGTITISGPGVPVPSRLPDGWTLANHVLTFAPATNVPTIGFTNDASTASESGTATLDLEFKNYTIPSDGVALTFNISGTAQRDLSSRDVSYGGNAINNPLVVNVPAGATSFNIDIKEDIRAEGDETLILAIDEARLPSGSALGTYGRHTITIPANDNFVSFTSDRATVLESAGQVTLPLRLASAIAPVGGLPLTLTVADNAGNSIASDKFSVEGQGAGNLDFDILPADGTETGVTVRFNADGDTNNETVVFTLTERSGFPGWGTVNSSRNEFTLTITDDVALSIGFAEERTNIFDDDGSSFDIELAVAGYTIPQLGVNVAMQVAASVPDMLTRIWYDGDQIMANLGSGSGEFTVLPGANTGDNPRITLNTVRDTRADRGGTLTFTLPATVAIGGATFTVPAAARTHTLTLEPNDGLAFFDSDENPDTVAEGAGSMMVTVSLSSLAPAPSTGLPLKLAVVDTAGEPTQSELVTFTQGTEDNDIDFSILAGRTEGKVELYINDNSIFGENDPVNFKLSPGENFPAGWTVASTADTYTLTVTDDDEAPAIGFAEASSSPVNEPDSSDSGDEVSVTISMQTRNYTIDSNHSFMFDVGGTAGLSDANYDNAILTNPLAVSFAAGETSFDIDINHDETLEYDETIILTLLDGAGDLPANVNRGDIFEHTITILASDNTVTFSEPLSSTVAEGASTTITAAVNLAVPQGTQPQPTIIITASGDAVKDTDYELSVPSNSSHGTLINVVGNTWTWTLPEGADSGETTRNAELTISSKSPTEKTLTLAFATGALPDGWNAAATSRDITLVPATTVGWADTTATYEPDSSGNGTFTASIAITPPAGMPAVTAFPEDGSLDLTLVATGSGTVVRANGAANVIPVSQTSPAFPLAVEFDVTGSASGTVTISDDTVDLPSGWKFANEVLNFIPQRVINFAQTSSFISEGSEALDIVLPLPPLDRQITLAVEETGTARSADYSLAVTGGSSYANGVLTIPARTDSVTFTMSITDDEIADSGETVILTLSERAAPDALPAGLSLGDSVSHTVTIADYESRVGITVGAPRSNRVGTLNEPGTGQASTLSVPVGALGVGASNNAASAASLARVMTEDAVLQVSLYAPVTGGHTQHRLSSGFVGDQERHQLDRNNPRNPDGTADYTIGTLTIDKDTGTGSFDITINEDTFPEGREWAFLRISDPNDALPWGWTMHPEHSDYRLVIYGNDNSARFAGWPRRNPGEFAPLSTFVGEGGETNMIVLLDNIAPGPLVAGSTFSQPSGGITTLIEVPQAYKDDIRITNLDDKISTYDQDSGRFTVHRITQGWAWFTFNDETDPWREASLTKPPIIAAGLKIEVLPDALSESEEVIEITLKDGVNRSARERAWGGVRNAPDTGSPRAPTSTTFTLRIPGTNDNIFFASSDSAVDEGNSTTLDVLIIPPLTRSASVLLTSSGDDVTITSPRYNAGSGVLTLPASTDKVTLTLETTEDGDAVDGVATLTLAARSADPLPSSHK
ncbi:MAG: hypothetical protein OXF05_04280, partial [Hyphomicrobiales bacterium]|nr:hypothetical protein [Hyphomicrobiales bacterium]